MNFLEKLAKRSEEQARLEALSNNTWHSSFYHNHYEGYSEYYELDERGKKRLRRIYTGPYYRPVLTKWQRRTCPLLRVALFVVAVVLFLIGAVQRAACNTAVYATIFQALTVAVLAWAFSGMVGHFSASGDLQAGAYKRSAVRLKHAALCGAILLFAETLAAVLAAVLADNFDTRSILCAALFLIAGSALLGLNRLEAGIVYQVIDNPTPEPPGSIQI